MLVNLFFKVLRKYCMKQNENDDHKIISIFICNYISSNFFLYIRDFNITL